MAEIQHGGQQDRGGAVLCRSVDHCAGRRRHMTIVGYRHKKAILHTSGQVGTPAVKR